MFFPTYDDAVDLNRFVVLRDGGLAGVRDSGILESAIESARMSFDGTDLYGSVEEKASRVAYETVSQHPFVDGNKRTGMAVLAAVLRGNDIMFKPRRSKLYDMFLALANGSSDYYDLLDFVKSSIE